MITILEIAGVYMVVWLLLTFLAMAYERRRSILFPDDYLWIVIMLIWPITLPLIALVYFLVKVVFFYDWVLDLAEGKGRGS